MCEQKASERDDVTALRTQLTQLTEENHRLQHALTTLRAEEDSLLKERQTLSHQVTSLQREYSAIRATVCH